MPDAPVGVRWPEIGVVGSTRLTHVVRLLAKHVLQRLDHAGAANNVVVIWRRLVVVSILTAAIYVADQMHQHIRNNNALNIAFAAVWSSQGGGSVGRSVRITCGFRDGKVFHVAQ